MKMSMNLKFFKTNDNLVMRISIQPLKTKLSYEITGR